MCLIITVIFMILCNLGTGISKIDSIILIGLFILFILYTIFMGIKGEQFDREDNVSTPKDDLNNDISIIKSIIFVILGAIGLKIGGDFTVDNSVIIAEHFNISEQIISLTILAIGTSLPELVTSVTAAIKGDSDIAIGNIIGSNIFNMLLIIGVSAFIKPIVYNPTYNIQMIILLFGTILLALFPMIPPKNEMNKPNGIIYLTAYFIYMIMLFKV